MVHYGVEPTTKHKSLAVASGATPIGNAVRVPDEIIKNIERKKKWAYFELYK